jgi:hypothetical protein
MRAAFRLRQNIREGTQQFMFQDLAGGCAVGNPVVRTIRAGRLYPASLSRTKSFNAASVRSQCAAIWTKSNISSSAPTRLLMTAA